VLEVLLLDRLAVYGGDSIARYAAASDSDSGESAESAQGQEESCNLDHEKALGRGDGNTGQPRAARSDWGMEPSSAEAW
jgi:hypothetical protein